MTKNKLKILEALKAIDDDTNFELGVPPRSAAVVALMIDGDTSNVARTLRNMERQGFVQSEQRVIDVWCEVPKPGHYPRPTKCYWNSKTIEEDRISISEWFKVKEKRRLEAEKKMMDIFYKSRG